MLERLSDRQLSLHARADEGFNDWLRIVALPYKAAYDTAFGRYQDTIAEQKKANEERVQLFVAAASIVTGSIMMAAFATASMRVLAARQTLNIVCRTNMNRIFNLMATAERSRGFMFGIGKILDEGKSQLSKVAESAVTSLVQSNSNILVSTPAVQDAHLQIFLRNHLACTKRVAAAVEHSHLPEPEKERAFDLLSNAPICLSPRRGINEERLAQRIELSFWMSLILDSDSLISWPAQPAIGGDAMATVVNARSHPIPQLPGDPNYPRPTPAKYGIGGMPAHQSIGYDRPGGVIRRRINKVYNLVYGHNFYDNEGWLGLNEPDARGKASELLAARRTLDRLSASTQPHSLADVNI